ncbi:MAG: hydrogenase nickel incorporation protein HypA/HybF [Gaiellales bacterium]|jgi:hydrogenase nickel incorporation protein HypA/HybF|nr:hydrogenase nickel incorporation protein HypA/HybF [Gaiellales bacterium]
MHELAIADSVLTVVLNHAGERRVTAVWLKVGHLRQVVPSALELSFELVCAGTAAEGATLEIESIPAAGVCRACGEESELPAFPLMCGACGGFDVDVVRGEELIVDSVEIDDAVMAQA